MLAGRLHQYADRSDVIALGLPRGGVPVAAEVASRLRVPLDVFVVRKLGVPGYRELAMGAIATGGVRIINEEIRSQFRVTDAALQVVIAEETTELERRELLYRHGRPPLDLEGRVVILTDDGLATGSTMRAAIEAVRTFAPSRVIVGVPVGSAEACQAMARVADDTICAFVPPAFSAVGQWYRDFSETSDEEVRELLKATLPTARPA